MWIALNVGFSPKAYDDPNASTEEQYIKEIISFYDGQYVGWEAILETFLEREEELRTFVADEFSISSEEELTEEWIKDDDEDDTVDLENDDWTESPIVEDGEEK